MRSDVFRGLWAQHTVRYQNFGVRRLRHPAIGEVQLSYEIVPLVTDEGLTLVTYTAARDSADADSLRLLAAWSAPGVDRNREDRVASDRSRPRVVD